MDTKNPAMPERLYIETVDPDERRMGTTYVVRADMPDGSSFAVYEATRKALAFEIVSRYNAHAALVGALKSVLDSIENMTSEDFGSGADRVVRETIRRALAAAKG